MGREEHVLLINMHHSISDGWSIGIFQHELNRLYNAFITNQPSPLPDLPIQYGDFAVWQQQWLQGDVLATQCNYWTKQLTDLTYLDLPTDRVRSPMQSFRGAHRGISLPRSLRDDLKTLSNREGVTLFMTLLAAFQVLLARYTRQHDIAVGTPIANRNRAELEGLIGFFINTLVLRTDLTGDPGFLTILQRVRKVCLAAYAHQDVPFEKIVEVLQPVRDLSRSPLFQVSFSLHHATRSTEELQGLTLSHHTQESTTTKFDLTLIVTETEQGLHCLFEYSTDLFDAITIDNLLNHFHNLLKGIVEQPAQRFSALPLLTDAERRQQLIDWNNTVTATPAEATFLHTQFESLAEDTPDAIAVVFQDEHLTYAGLNRYANQLAHYLLNWGQAPSRPGAEKLVGLFLPRSPHMIIGILGTLKAGGAYLPLDPAYPPERLHYLIQDAQPVIMVTQQTLLDRVPSEQEQVLCLDTAWPLITQQLTSNPALHVHADNIAYVIYTSGSTGKPKGVLVSQRNAVHSTQARLLYYREAVKQFLLLSSFAFDSSVAGIFWTLSQGGVLVLPPEDLVQDVFLRALPLRLHRLLPNLRHRKETPHLLCVPSLYALLLQYGQKKLGCLRTAIVAGEACPLALVEQHMQLLPELPLFNEYGPTEASVWSSVAQCIVDAQPPSIGGPIANTQIYLLDQSLQLVPKGVAGEVYIGGEGVVRGYLQQPALTAERFVPHPFTNTPGARLYKTGDIARYRQDGQIDYLGRDDYQVKIRGYRIELGEIEALLRSHSAIQECVVTVHEGPDNKRLVAYFVVRQQCLLTIEDLRADISRKLPNYMQPEVFIQLDAFPLTPNGKVDRLALPPPTVYREGVGSLPNDHTSPGTSVEEIVAGLWCKLLDRQQVSIHDNFFALGGHSLLAVRLIAQIQTVFQVTLSLRHLFEMPTVAALATQIERELQRGREQSGELPALISVTREEELPLSFAQQRLWFIDQLETEQTAYTIPQVTRVSGLFHMAAFTRSLTEMTRRHESLRTIFAFRAGRSVQIILPVTPFHLPVIDLSALPRTQCEAEIQQLTRQETTRRFDLAQGPLLRAVVLRTQENEHILVQTMHHIITDGWSLDIFMREVSTLYDAFVAGQPSPLPELPLQYADFALWQRQWLQGKVLEQQLAYWREQLHGLTPVPLPIDYPRPPIQLSSGAQQRVVLPASLRDNLVALSQQENVTLFMTLLAAFQVLLSRYTGQTDIAVGSPITNRNRTELQGLIGIFVNTLVLRTNLSANPTFRELLTRVREVCLGAYAHQDIPFEKLVEVLQPERDLSRSSLVQVVFILQQAQDKKRSSTAVPTGLKHDMGSIEITTAKQELTLALKDTPDDGLQGSIVYSTDLFHASTIQLMVRHFTKLLEQIAANPEWCLFDIPLSADEEPVDAASDDDTMFNFE